MSSWIARGGAAGILVAQLWFGGWDANLGWLDPQSGHRSPQPGPPTARPLSPDPPKAPQVLANESAGVGIALGKEQESIVIKRILPNSIAALNKAIRVGDRVLAVADEKKTEVILQGKTVVEAVALIRGPKGTSVRLTLVPAGKGEANAHVVTLVRSELRPSRESIPFKEMPGWGDGVLLSAGREAPDIKMTTVPGGKLEKLADFRGKVVVLEFWATWCAPCQKIMSDLQGVLKKNPSWRHKVVVIAASVDEDGAALIKHLTAKDWHETHNVQVGTEAKKAYHVGRVSTQYVIDQRGKVVAADASDVSDIVNRLIGQK